MDEPLAYEAYTGTKTPGSGSVIELLANRLGSIITAISVSTEAVVANYDDQAYGARFATGSVEQPYGFTGREHDAESGLIHLRARAYDPVAGVFLQVDPIGFAGGQGNLFAFGANTPISGSGPSGLSVLSMRQINDATAQMKRAALIRVSNGALSLGIGIAEALTQAARGMLVRIGTH